MSQLDERGIDRLLQVAEERDLAFLHVRVGGSELTIARVPPSELAMADLPGSAPARHEVPEEPSEPQGRPAPGPPPSLAGAAPKPPPAGVGGGDTIDAPMVGAFYRAPAPGQPPFVEVGSTVEVGDTVGLIEAMKIFTAVPATYAGIVAEILVENGAFVEFGQPLVRVEAAEAARQGTGARSVARG